MTGKAGNACKALTAVKHKSILKQIIFLKKNQKFILTSNRERVCLEQKTFRHEAWALCVYMCLRTRQAELLSQEAKDKRKLEETQFVELYFIDWWNLESVKTGVHKMTEFTLV